MNIIIYILNMHVCMHACILYHWSTYRWIYVASAIYIPASTVGASGCIFVCVPRSSLSSSFALQIWSAIVGSLPYLACTWARVSHTLAPCLRMLLDAVMRSSNLLFFQSPAHDAHSSQSTCNWALPAEGCMKLKEQEIDGLGRPRVGQKSRYNIFLLRYYI